MKKLIFPSLLIPAIAAIVPLTASAVCPVCTVAAAGGVGLSRYLGIDDAITGLWLGGVTVSFIMWTENWLDQKTFRRKGKEFTIRFKGRIYADILIYVLLIILPLYTAGIMGHPDNAMAFFGIDKLLFGVINGAVTFWFGASLYEYLKARNGGHAYFPFQKVVMPILPLIIVSIIFYFLTK